MDQCLYNTCSNNVAAYCRYHKLSMTVKQIRCKNCLGKECKHLQKNEKHSWWKQRDVAKERRLARKNAATEYYNFVTRCC